MLNDKILDKNVLELADPRTKHILSITSSIETYLFGLEESEYIETSDQVYKIMIMKMGLFPIEIKNILNSLDTMERRVSLRRGQQDSAILERSREREVVPLSRACDLLIAEQNHLGERYQIFSRGVTLSTLRHLSEPKSDSVVEFERSCNNFSGEVSACFERIYGSLLSKDHPITQLVSRNFTDAESIVKGIITYLKTTGREYFLPNSSSNSSNVSSN